MNPFLGGIFLVGFNFSPTGYAFCDGQLLQISQNTALFSLLGTNYGGDGVQTFALPNLRGRVPVHMGNNGISNYVIGQSAGVESVALSTSQMPVHSHLFNVNNAPGTTSTPGNTVYLAAGPETGSGPNATALHTYTATAANVNLNPATIANAGGTNAVPVLSPYLCVNFIIALNGIFPSRN